MTIPILESCLDLPFLGGDIFCKLYYRGTDADPLLLHVQNTHTHPRSGLLTDPGPHPLPLHRSLVFQPLFLTAFP
jgi:hypothetical protein